MLLFSICAHAADAVPVSIFAACGYAVPLVRHEALQELERVLAELSAARSDRSRDASGREPRDTPACDLGRESGIFDLFLGDPEEASRANFYMEQVWSTTLAVDERVLFDERAQSHGTEPALSGSLAGAEK